MLISVRDSDKAAVLPVAQKLEEMGFAIIATRNTARFLGDAGVSCEAVHKISEGRPHILDFVQDGKIQWIVNTSMGTRTTEDSYTIRRSALDYHIPYTTTIAGAQAMVMAIATMRNSEMEVRALQEYFD